VIDFKQFINNLQRGKICISQDCDSCCRGFEPHQPPHLSTALLVPLHPSALSQHSKRYIFNSKLLNIYLGEWLFCCSFAVLGLETTGVLWPADYVGKRWDDHLHELKSDLHAIVKYFQASEQRTEYRVLNFAQMRSADKHPKLLDGNAS
jgi:hypothetical protein